MREVWQAKGTIWNPVTRYPVLVYLARMPRPRTALNTFGSIATTGQVQDDSGRWVKAPIGVRPTRWKARVKHRDRDGVLRDVTRFASTKGKAEALLKAALAERSTPLDGDEMRGETTVEEAGRAWLAQVERSDSGLSDNTRAQYRAAFERYVVGSSIASLTLREANRIQVLEKWLREVADRRGGGAAKTARSVLSGTFTLAMRYQVLEHNAVREVRPAKPATPKASERDTGRAFTREERQRVLDSAAVLRVARELDVTDIVYWLAGTGVRISEALGQQVSGLDLEKGTVLVLGTKSGAATRVLNLPPWLLERTAERVERKGLTGAELLFPSPSTADRTQPRDRRNVARIIRTVLDDAGCPWATPHTFRRTVATYIDQAGLPIAVAANQLGHADPAMTARVYLGRRGGSAEAAGVL